MMYEELKSNEKCRLRDRCPSPRTYYVSGFSRLLCTIWPPVVE